MSTALELALSYRRRGFSVVPIKAGTKSPKGITKWEQYQKKTASETVIRHWFKVFPNSGVGIVTGKVSNLLVIDIDPRNGGSEKGFPPTGVRVATGGGGVHLYYKLPEKDFGKYSNGDTGVDVLANGAYVVAPPTIHPETGEPYVWDPDDEELGTIDIETINRLAPRPNGKSTTGPDGQLEAPPRSKDWHKEFKDSDTSEGGRNQAIAKSAGYYARRGKPIEWTISELQKHNEAKFKPPIPFTELEATVRSIYKAEDRNPAPRSSDKPTEESTNALRKKYNVLRLDEYAIRYGGQSSRWLIPGYVPDRTICYIYGPPGSYKTWVEFDIAVSIASGLPFINDPKAVTTRKGPVLILQQEDSTQDIAERLSTIYMGKIGVCAPRIEDDVLITDNFDPELPIYIQAEQDFRFDDPHKVAVLLKLIDEIKPVAVFFDPLYRLVPIEENMETAVEHMAFLKELRNKTGITFFIVHHTTKASAGQGNRQGLHGSQYVNAFGESGISVCQAWQVPGTTVMKLHTKSSGAKPTMRLDFDIFDGAAEEPGEWRYSVTTREISSKQYRNLASPQSDYISDEVDNPKPKETQEEVFLKKLTAADEGMVEEEFSAFPRLMIARLIRAGKVRDTDGVLHKPLTL